MPLIISIKNISIVTSGFLIVMGNFVGLDPFLEDFQLIYIILGTVIGVIALALSIFITKKKDTNDIDDLIVFNNMLYWLIVGTVLTYGSLFDNELQIQLLFLNSGLIIGLFIMFMYIWILLRQKLSFLNIEDVNFTSAADNENIPQFLLVSMIMGCIFAGLFIGFQVFYTVFGYNLTSYWFLGILFVFTLTISVVLRYAIRVKK